MEQHPCRCGCGLLIAQDKQFARGHWSRTSAAREMYRARRVGPVANPTGLCFCGCGQTTPIATKNSAARGYYKGDHVRYVLGHQVPHGENNHRWRGGRCMKRGYPHISAPDHPWADKDGYVPEHRYVMGQHIGRTLEPHEQVHHINGDKTDNRLENLVLLTKAEHHAIHRDALNQWRATLTPEQAKAHASKAGKKGAAGRWKR